jgi:hypothetical protein
MLAATQNPMRFPDAGRTLSLAAFVAGECLTVASVVFGTWLWVTVVLG